VLVFAYWASGATELVQPIASTHAAAAAETTGVDGQCDEHMKSMDPQMQEMMQRMMSSMSGGMMGR